MIGLWVESTTIKQFKITLKKTWLTVVSIAQNTQSLNFNLKNNSTVYKHITSHFPVHRYSPIGILFLVAAKIVEMEDPEKTFQQLMYYFITVMTGLVIHGFVTLPLIYFVIVRRNPFKFMYGVTQALVTAIGTSSRWGWPCVPAHCIKKCARFCDTFQQELAVEIILKN